MKIDIRLQQGCLPWSPVFEPDHVFEYAFHRVLFLAHIYLCLPLILFKRAICTSRHGSPENYTCCMCHQSCRPREGVKRAVTEIWTFYYSPVRDVCHSIRPSVHLSVRHNFVAAQYLEKSFIEFIQILYVH